MERDVPYVPDGDDSQTLDLYLPKTPAGRPLPLIVHIHGGGWRGGSKFPCPFVGMVAQGYVVASLEGNKAKTDAVSPVRYVSKDSPPMLILHGTHDALVPFAQSEQFAAALKEQGVAVWLQALPGSGHGGPVFGKPSILGLMKTFFDRHLKGADVTVDLVPPEAVAVEPPASEAK
jgi:dipeptidyl aminopeptidase/acylaminoacyl peptidase